MKKHGMMKWRKVKNNKRDEASCASQWDDAPCNTHDDRQDQLDSIDCVQEGILFCKKKERCEKVVLFQQSNKKRGESLPTLSGKDAPGRKPSARFLRNAESLTEGMFSSVVAVVLAVVLGFPIVCCFFLFTESQSVKEDEKKKMKIKTS